MGDERQFDRRVGRDHPPAVRGVRRRDFRTGVAKPFQGLHQTLRKMGDNDLKVERTGVRNRHRAGTLERVVKYCQKTFSKAWDYLASSPSDGEDD